MRCIQHKLPFKNDKLRLYDDGIRTQFNTCKKSQRLLDSSGKMKNFQNFSRVRPKSKFCTDETKKPTVDDVKI